MAEITSILTGAELVYLVQQHGGAILPGVDDPFRGLSEAERTQLTIDVEDSLQERGYRKRAFGGKTTYDENLSHQLDLCSQFEYYIGFDCRKTKGKLITERFYGLNGSWLRISGNASEFLLTIVSAEDVKKALETLPTDKGSQSDLISLLIPKREFKSIGYKVQRGKVSDATAQLAQLDADELGKTLLLDGIRFMTDYSALTLVQRKGNEIKAKNVATLVKDGMVAEFYETVADDDRTMIGLRPAHTGSWEPLKEVANSWLTASL